MSTNSYYQSQKIVMHSVVLDYMMRQIVRMILDKVNNDAEEFRNLISFKYQIIRKVSYSFGPQLHFAFIIYGLYTIEISSLVIHLQVQSWLEGINGLEIETTTSVTPPAEFTIVRPALPTRTWSHTHRMKTILNR